MLLCTEVRVLDILTGVNRSRCWLGCEMYFYIPLLMSLLIQCYYSVDPILFVFVSWKDRLLLSFHQFIQEMLSLSEKFPLLFLNKDSNSCSRKNKIQKTSKALTINPDPPEITRNQENQIQEQFRRKNAQGLILLDPLIRASSNHLLGTAALVIRGGCITEACSV